MLVQAERIEKLEELLQKYVGEDKKIVEEKITRLTLPGENFGSTMLKVDLVLANKNEEKEPLHIVAKLIPEIEIFQQIFNIKVTFNIEAAFYQVIFPTMQEFQKEQGVTEVIDFAPRFYGSRKNLNDDDEIDANAVILLENLKISGYQNLDRFIGCDLHVTKMILTDLAKFHAVPLAIKLLKPETFETKIKKYMACFNPQRPHFDETFMFELVFSVLEQNEGCQPLLDKLRKSFELQEEDVLSFREPFATLSHKDMWINNFMVKIEDGKVVKTKLVDFQFYTYQSPVRDLVFYLFTSVQLEVLKEHLDYLLEFYHKKFMETLEELQCPTKEFSFEMFSDEIRSFGVYEIYHLLFMTIIVVFGRKAESKEGSFEQPALYTKDDMPQKLKERSWWIMQEFGRRQWLTY